eukprot:789214-Alexandrium_andersonii.AAC.1
MSGDATSHARNCPAREARVLASPALWRGPGSAPRGAGAGSPCRNPRRCGRGRPPRRDRYRG